jgi:hypothetical protein
MQHRLSVFSRWLWILVVLLPSWQATAAGPTPTITPTAEPVPAAAPADPGPPALAPAKILCVPGIYLQMVDDCAPAGPSAYLTSMAADGIIFPLRELAYSRPSPDLVNIDTKYGQVHTNNAPVYASLDDAVRGVKKSAASTMNGSFVFISYDNEQVVNGKRYYEISDKQWMTAADVARLGTVPRYQGLTFNSTPERPFGWVLNYAGPLVTKRTPGLKNGDYTGHTLDLHQIVQVYRTQKEGDSDWYMIGPDEWVPARTVARVLPNPSPPQGVQGDRWIEVNLFEQTLAVYDKDVMVFATLIASGAEPFYTQPGVFKIYQKHEKTPMRGGFSGDNSDSYYLEDVPWTMYFDNARALHGAYWRAKLGYAQSHGCVNLTVGDAHWLFDWAGIGDYVYVWDPSGKTPTDPTVYKDGGY